MKNKPYKVTGDPENGFRIAVPSEARPQKGDLYDFSFVQERMNGMIIPAGSLVYVPVVRQVEK